MIHINLLTCTAIRELPEWDKDTFPEDKYDIQYNSEKDIVWDCVVARQDVPYPLTFKCRKGGVIYTNCEPPMACPLPHSFTNQFDFVIVQNPKVKHPNVIQHHGFESWTVGRSFETKKNLYFYKDFANLEPEKTKLISVVSSNQRMLPGHIKRVEVIEKLLKDFPNEIDVFGRGYKYIDVKGEAMFPYRFHICIENAFIPNCLTEKFADPVLAQCVPIYAGCTNIKDIFGEEGYIPFDIDDYDSLKSIVETILKDPDHEYLKYKNGLENLRKILMEKENIIPFIVDYIEKHPSSDIQEYTLKPLRSFKSFGWQNNILRLRRFLYKKSYQIYKFFK